MIIAGVLNHAVLNTEVQKRWDAKLLPSLTSHPKPIICDHREQQDTECEALLPFFPTCRQLVSIHQCTRYSLTNLGTTSLIYLAAHLLPSHDVSFVSCLCRRYGRYTPCACCRNGREIGNRQGSCHQDRLVPLHRSSPGRLALH
jgi:hypothetical protein